MSRVVLDASALVALLRREPGLARVAKVLGRSVMSSVNLAEVLTRSVDLNADLDRVTEHLRLLPLTIVDFGSDDAALAASLRRATREAGLSLGDRCCLALGLRTGRPVLTTDRLWASLDVGVQIELIR